METKIWTSLGHYYIHDLMVANDTVWAGAINEGRMHAIANPDAGTLTEAFSWSYAGAASHAGWLHTDHRFFIGCDETSGGLYAGNWGVFPYFQSGTIISSDMARGLHVLTLDSYTGIAGSPALVPPRADRLHQNMPNPFNPTTEIGFDRWGTGEHTLEIYDVNGRMVRTLFRGAPEEGTTSLTWDGTDDAGHHAGSGTYLYRLTGPETIDQKKMILIC